MSRSFQNRSPVWGTKLRVIRFGCMFLQRTVQETYISLIRIRNTTWYLIYIHTGTYRVRNNKRSCPEFPRKKSTRQSMFKRQSRDPSSTLGYCIQQARTKGIQVSEFLHARMGWKKKQGFNRQERHMYYQIGLLLGMLYCWTVYLVHVQNFIEPTKQTHGGGEGRGASCSPY